MNQILAFCVFAKGLTTVQDGQDSSGCDRNHDGNPTLCLCDSTRDRKNILLHIFQPLTKDIFVFKTTQQIFEQIINIHTNLTARLVFFFSKHKLFNEYVEFFILRRHSKKKKKTQKRDLTWSPQPF